MKLHPIIFLASIVTFTFASAQSPDWVKNQGKSTRFPESRYLTGYGMAVVKDDAANESARNAALSDARRNLTEKVRVNIQSVVATKSEETGDKYSSFFSSATQSTSNLDIQGLESEVYFDNDEKIFHVFVVVKREDLTALYMGKVSQYKRELEEKLRLATSHEQHAQSTLALNEYLSCYPLVRQLEEAQSLLAFLKISASLSELQTSAVSNEVTIGQVREAVVRLVRRPIATVDDLAWFLVYQLKEQAQQNESGKMRVRVLPLVYQDTKMGSSFARYFVQVMEQQVTEVAQWNAGQSADVPYVLSGSYWEQKDVVKFIVNVRSVKDGVTIGSAEATVSPSIFSALNRSLKPENYASAMADQKIFASGETAGGGLKLEGWTNKTVQGNLFVEGETMKVFVRVNMPCHIRFLYHLADGKRALLYDDYFLDASKVNIAYEIPQEFECASPFGGEVLQIFARTDKFDPVSTESKDGYEYLKEDLQRFVVNSRGMKAAKVKTMQTEMRIQITTMKN